MQAKELAGRSSVTRSNSVSVLMKEKISIALGKAQQNRQKSSKKVSQVSYLGKERSSSLKSLGKTCKSSIPKNDSNVIQKLSFFEQTPVKQRNVNQSELNKQEGQKLRLSESNRQVEAKSLHNTNESTRRWDELLWIDSRNRKLKIVNKSVQTFGDDGKKESFIEYVVAGEPAEQPLVRISGQKLILIDNKEETFYLGKYDENLKKRERISDPKPIQSISLNFQGYIFIISGLSNKNMKKCEQMFSFFLEQIQKLIEDGVKEFVIIAKIMKRTFQERFRLEGEEEFLLLLRVQGRESIGKKKTLDTERLISQKLLCVQKAGESSNLKLMANKFFNKQKY